MLPSPASQPAETAGVSMRAPSIAPHLRVQMAGSDSPHAHGSRDACAASASRAHDRLAPPGEEGLHLSGTHMHQPEVPFSAWQGDQRIDVEDMVSDSRPTPDLQHLQAKNGHVPHREQSSAVGQISSADVAAHAVEDGSSSGSLEAQDAASRVSLQGRGMREALQRAQNGHTAPLEPITLQDAAPANMSINSIEDGAASSASSAGSEAGDGAYAVGLRGRSMRGIVFDLETTGEATACCVLGCKAICTSSRIMRDAIRAQPSLCYVLAQQRFHGAVTSQHLCHAGFPSKQNYILEIAAEDLESGEKWGTLVRIPEKVG